MADEADVHPRTRLVVLFGGRSAEHEISCISARHVLAAVDRSRYELVPVGITAEGTWVTSDSARTMLEAGPGGVIPEAVEAKGAPVTPDDVLESGGPFEPHSPQTVVLPILHGPNGEDGTVQGLLELAGVPYVGSGVLGSSVAMDKAMAKTVLGAHGLHQARWRTLRVADRDNFGAEAAESTIAELGPDVFVKPANMGSSIGISKVRTADGLQTAIDEALLYDDLVILEQGVEGREIECAVLGNDDPIASVVGEIITTADFYDYGDKYFDGTSQPVVPADVPQDISDRLRSTALSAFGALRCSGMARVDMFLCDDDILVNEVNTIPGFTPISMYPMMWEASGIGYTELIDRLVELAIERHNRRSSHKLSPS
jgi:D-alanine-D-alanine ligase